jgi:hypothetical protein
MNGSERSKDSNLKPEKRKCRIKSFNAKQSLEDDVKAAKLISESYNAKTSFARKTLNLIFHVETSENKKQQVEIGVHMFLPRTLLSSLSLTLPVFLTSADPRKNSKRNVEQTYIK